MSLRIVPVNRDQAVAFIADWHRHHAPPLGYRYALGVAADDLMVGVATVGRPVARHYDDGLTVEVTRVATDGTPHACSALYGACWRAARAMGYSRALTYTHATTEGPVCGYACAHGSCRMIRASETGYSLRAAGWREADTRKPRSGWSMPARRRDDSNYVSVARRLWFAEASGQERLPSAVSRRTRSAPAQVDLFSELGIPA